MWHDGKRPWNGLFRPFTFYIDLYEEVVVAEDIDFSTENGKLVLLFFFVFFVRRRRRRISVFIIVLIYFLLVLEADLSFDDPRLHAARARVAHSPLALCEKISLFYGARVLPVVTHATTHIIVARNGQSPRMTALRRAMRQLLAAPPHRAKHLLTEDWVFESANKHSGY